MSMLKYKNSILLLCATLFTFISAETALRIFGYSYSSLMGSSIMSIRILKIRMSILQMKAILTKKAQRLQPR